MEVKGSKDSSHPRIQSYKSEQPAVMTQAHGEVSKDESTQRDQLHPALSQSCESVNPPSARQACMSPYCHQQLKTKLGNSRNETEQKYSRGKNLEQGSST